MRSRFTRVLVLIAGLTLATAGCGKYSINNLRATAARGDPGLTVHIAGPAASAADAVKIFKGIDTTLLYATLLPSAPGYVGSLEAGGTFLLSNALGLPRATAAGAMVLWHALAALMVVAMGNLTTMFASHTGDPLEGNGFKFCFACNAGQGYD